MRMLASRYADPKPMKVKQVVSQVAHISAPLRGLNLSSKLTTGDPLSAPILINFVVDDDRITCRAGYRKLATVAGDLPVERLIPWYGSVPKLGAAVGGGIYNAETGALIKTGFTGNDWSFTAFSNLGEKDYTVMVNGHDGVWSWDGGLTTVDPGAVNVTLSAANPCVATLVTPADISKFQNGMTVVVAGAVGPYSVANGARMITNVGAPAGKITLVGVNTAGATGTNTATIDPPATAGLMKETIAVPTDNPWIVPDHFHIVIPHMNRLWFADPSNLAVYYLPLMQKNTSVTTPGPTALGVLPLNALFRRGGSIRAMASWTVEGGEGTNDQLVIFSSNGECVIYQGTNPSDLNNWGLVGIFRFDAPMSKHCVVNWGGDLWVLISTGMVPLSQLTKAESEQLGQIDKAVIGFFLGEAISHRSDPGWQAFINPSSNRVFCNIPQGSPDRYTQLVRHMPRPVWSQFKDIPSRCWAWIDPYVYFGDDHGNVYRMHPDFLSDDGKEILIDVQPAWSLYKTPGIKHFKMLRTYTIADAQVQPFVDVKVDYDLSTPTNQPDVVIVNEGATWDEATWDVDYWAQGVASAVLWNGCAGIGRVGAPRFVAKIKDCHYSITGWDVLYETGAAV